jgi:lipoprotein-anchoring transpeptidase ErfK/SrfK
MTRVVRHASELDQWEMVHGAPDPRLIGKRASHGCVRLTNWDAAELGSAIRKGTVVVFQGAEKTFKA